MGQPEQVNIEEIEPLGGSVLVRREKEIGTFIPGGRIIIPQRDRKRQSQTLGHGYVTKVGQPVYKYKKASIPIQDPAFKEGDKVLFVTHGDGGELDVSFTDEEGNEYVLVMYHELLGVFEE